MNDSLVIIPTYDEKENISEITKAVFALEQPFDILVVDDSSPDGTGQIVKDAQKKQSDRNQLYLIERSEKTGLGPAYVEGFKFALQHGYDFIFEMDADFSHNPEDLLRLYHSCKTENIDLTVGSRYISGVNVVNWPLARVLLSLSASVYVRWITGMPVRDSTAGFVCYRRPVLERINLDKIRFEGYAFQIEMKHVTWKAGFKVVEIPIIFRDRVRGKSKMSISIFREAFWGVILMRLSNYRKKLNP